MEIYRIEFYVKTYCENLTQVKEWINFRIGATGSMKNENPLADTDLKAEWNSVSIEKLRKETEL